MGAQIAAISNVVAGALVTCMLIVQLQIRWTDEDAGVVGEHSEVMVDWLWQVVLGLDVSFDVFIGIGTLLFGLAMFRDPLFGRIVGTLGALVGAIVILGFNLVAFPELPVEAGLLDPGPITGLWYLLVVLIVMLRRKRILETH